MKRPWSKRRREPAPALASGSPPLAIDATPAPFGAVVSITGELDIATVPRARAVLQDEPVSGATAVVVDLSGVTFMDSTGLAVVMDLKRELDARRGRLTIACPEGPARLLFDVTGVADQLALYGTREEAEAAAPAPPRPPTNRP
jgi:anti-sigma B factor antagonist